MGTDTKENRLRSSRWLNKIQENHKAAGDSVKLCLTKVWKLTNLRNSLTGRFDRTQ